MGGAALLLAASGFLGGAAGIGIVDDACLPSTVADARSVLDRLQSELESGNVAGADEVIPAALSAARNAARCAPTQSANWLVLARLEALSAGVTPELSRLVVLSCRTAPTQLWTASDRLRMFGRFAGGLEEPARACLENDRRLVALAEEMRAR